MFFDINIVEKENRYHWMNFIVEAKNKREARNIARNYLNKWHNAEKWMLGKARLLEVKDGILHISEAYE